MRRGFHQERMDGKWHCRYQYIYTTLWRYVKVEWVVFYGGGNNCAP